MTVTNWALTTATYHDTVTDIGAGTDRRDVSEMLDLWAHKETPFLNKLTWGPETGATSIEWISEHLGFGYIVALSIATSATASLAIDSGGMGTAALALEQVTSGTILFHYNSALSTYTLLAVSEVPGGGVTVAYDIVAYSTSAEVEIAVGEKMYILGDVANEGSGPNKDKSRTRAVLSNKLMIQRKDIQITGSMAATDFHAVEDELRHQIQMRLKEMQRDREMLILLTKAVAQSATVAGVMNGVLGFLLSQTGDHIVNSSTALTETGVNDMMAALYENNSTPNCLVLPTTQARKFTTWDRDKIRTTPDARLSGHFVTNYLTDVGVEIQIIMMRQFPVNMGFLVDTTKIHPRAKKGRKLFIEKLGIDGDRTRYQIISEYSLEMRGYDQGQHGMWTSLTT
uniref:Putative major capsid protein n=1 Tax=viral metagenome TaxID=1070528 RepID=A0A6M3IZP0_9ZZZZ